MDFNVPKCFSMSVTLKKNIIASEYYISDDLVEKVQSYKYLGSYKYLTSTSKSPYLFVMICVGIRQLIW